MKMYLGLTISGFKNPMHMGLMVATMIWTLMSVFQFAAAAASDDQPPCHGECNQTRDLAPHIWGGIVTLITLTIDAWGFASTGEFAWRLLLVFVAGPIMPVWSLIEVIGKALVGMTLTHKLGRSTLTFAKSNAANIIAQCDVLLGVSEEAAARFSMLHTEKNYGIDVLLTPLEVGNRREISEALILLNDRGKEALLRADVLPKYEQLCFLQGYSGLAIAVSAVQATGYIFSTITRVSQNLNVTPVERISTALSFIVLVKAGLYTIASSSHHPLLLHIPSDQENIVVDACKDTKYGDDDEFRVEVKTLICTELVLLLLFSLAVVAIVHLLHHSYFDALPSFFFAFGIFLQMIIAVLMFGKSIRIPKLMRTKYCSILVIALCSMANVAAYSMALVATVMHWHDSGFDIESRLSNALPHIGVLCQQESSLMDQVTAKDHRVTRQFHCSRRLESSCASTRFDSSPGNDNDDLFPTWQRLSNFTSE